MTKKLSHKRVTPLTRFYYGAPYYPEHWDAATREQDVQRMVDAGFNVVRMAEFAWDYLEPEEGTFRFDIFDETIARLGASGIATILCTPTPTPPRWLTFAHPDVLRVNADGVVMQHGSRQHVCHTSETFRAYSRAITREMADHYAENPHVVGWQTDNELNCHFSECHCDHCQAAFREFLRAKYEGDIDALNVAWGNAFWALTYRNFDEILTPKSAKPAYANPAHLLDYDRFISWNVTRFQHEQVEILRAANPRWFITHNGIFRHIDYRGSFTEDLDFLGYDIYPFFDPDPQHRPASQSFNLDHARAWSGNFMVPEQQSGPGGQGNYFHDTPEPDEMRRMAYTSIARGADSLMFFRWRTCRFGAEEYWCGIFDHDNVPRRRYKEVQQLGEELKTIGPEVLGTHVRVDVGIAAADMDVYDAHETLSMGLPSPYAVAATVHEFFLNQGYAVGCVHPSDDLSDLKVYIIPHWALINPDWMPHLEAYVENGGLLIIGARTGTKDWNNNVVADPLPGMLQKLAGVRILEYGRQNAPDKRPLGIQYHRASAVLPTEHWYEQLQIMPKTMTIARWEGRHLSRQTAITIRQQGEGTVIYVGTYLSGSILAPLLPLLEELTGLAPLWPDAPAGVHVVVRENEEKRLWFAFNDTDSFSVLQPPVEGTDLITGKPSPKKLYLMRHRVAVIKETLVEAEEQGSEGAEEQGSEGAEEQGSEGAEEQRSKGAEERGSEGAEEQGSERAEERGNESVEEVRQAEVEEKESEGPEA
ncbi:MAG: beta-galactosidase [Anaerolineae bacterium]|nr:beta-galactosidase [Anaerolineae bacterium]